MSSEKSRAGELTTPIQKEPSVPTTRRLTTAEKQAQQEAEEDRTLLTNYFERIGRRQRIHEAAVYHHLKYRSKDTLALLVSTFDSLYRVEMQTPPSLIREDLAPIDAKAAIARGRALAFTEDPSEAELAWTYNNRISGETLENAWAEANSDANSNAQGAPPAPAASSSATNGANRTAFSADEAKLALDHIQNLARRLLPERDSDCYLLD